MTRAFGLRMVRLAASSEAETAFLQTLGQRYRAWRARWSTKSALNALDDHTLHDIGLRRAEIDSVSYEVALLRYRVRPVDLGTMRRRMLQQQAWF